MRGPVSTLVTSALAAALLACASPQGDDGALLVFAAASLAEALARGLAAEVSAVHEGRMRDVEGVLECRVERALEEVLAVDHQVVRIVEVRDIRNALDSRFL